MPFLNLRRAPALELRHEQTCTVCDRARDEAQAESDRAEAMLFGSVEYAVCPGCHQIAHKPLFDDAEYRRKYRLYVFLNYNRVIRED